jgi:hypothetical protein
MANRCRRSLTVAICVDPIGRLGKTSEEEVVELQRETKELFPECQLSFHRCVHVSEVQVGTDLFLFDFGGMSMAYGSGALIQDNSRGLIRWCEDNPNSLALVMSSFTYENCLEYELKELGFAGLPNLLNWHQRYSEPDIQIPEWFLLRQAGPAPLRGLICERCHHRFDDELYNVTGTKTKCKRCGKMVCESCLSRPKKAAICIDCISTKPHQTARSTQKDGRKGGGSP